MTSLITTIRSWETRTTKLSSYIKMYMSMEEAVSTFQSVVAAEQRNCGPQPKRPLAENKNPASRSNQEQGMDKSIKRQKLFESQTIAVGVDAVSEVCGKNPTEQGVIRTGKKVYRPPLTSTYKETELLEDLNDGMECLFRDYGRSFKKKKDPLQPRDDMMEFYVKTYTNELDQNLKL